MAATTNDATTSDATTSDATTNDAVTSDAVSTDATMAIEASMMTATVAIMMMTAASGGDFIMMARSHATPRRVGSAHLLNHGLRIWRRHRQQSVQSIRIQMKTMMTCPT